MTKNNISDRKENSNGINQNSTYFVGKYYYGYGGRKTALAKIRLYQGNGTLIINNKKIVDNDYTSECLKPLELTNKKNKFNISVLAKGGGKIAWIGAIQLGIARALLVFDKKLRPTLKKQGFLRRDPRIKERKKPGLKGARRAPQFSKR